MSVPKRIVSLLPGATEWVCKLGLGDRLVGVSHECDFPELANSLPSVTRSRIHVDSSSREIDEAVREHSETRTPLYELDSAVLNNLQPDLILTQSLCNVCAVSERDVRGLAERMDRPCVVLDLPAQTFDDVIGDARAIAESTGNQARSLSVIASIERRVVAVRDRVNRELSGADPAARPRATLLEWVDPLYCSGHWTPQLIQWAGGIDPIGKAGQPSREIPFETLVDANPDILLVACCGMDLQRSKLELARLEQREGWSGLLAPTTQNVHVFDGSAFFNRPGPRLVDTLEDVAEIVRQWHAQA
ncbi:MAG: ABC transporter substrate-binding protein [Rubripirellula sp.]